VLGSRRLGSWVRGVGFGMYVSYRTVIYLGRMYIQTKVFILYTASEELTLSFDFICWCVSVCLNGFEQYRIEEDV
jgi:hypothetical protein